MADDSDVLTSLEVVLIGGPKAGKSYRFRLPLVPCFHVPTYGTPVSVDLDELPLRKFSYEPPKFETYSLRKWHNGAVTYEHCSASPWSDEPFLGLIYRAGIR